MKKTCYMLIGLAICMQVNALSIRDLSAAGKLPQPNAKGNIDLSHKGLTSIDGIEELVAMHHQVRSIDLSRNKITHINANQIAAAGQRLRSVNLSYNPLTAITRSRDKLKVILILTGTRFESDNFGEE